MSVLLEIYVFMKNYFWASDYPTHRKIDSYSSLLLFYVDIMWGRSYFRDQSGPCMPLPRGSTTSTYKHSKSKRLQLQCLSKIYIFIIFDSIKVTT